MAQNIKVLREARGLKQADVARHVGLDSAAYSRTERGLRNITVDELAAVASLLGVTIDELVNRHAPGTPPPGDVSLADANAAQQARLIQELDEDDRRAVERIVERMVTTKRLRDYLNANLELAA